MTTRSNGFIVLGDIEAKWLSLGGERGQLGRPLSFEIPLGDGGQLQRFEGGALCWHIGTGAHLLKGAIAERWEQLGRNAFGYPITDEMPAIDGGFFNHFLAIGVPDQPERSIYAHPNTGAHEVLDEIRKKWASTGWDQGQLGYPRGPEITLDDGVGKMQLYQKGWICWHQETGAHIIRGLIATRWEELGRNHYGYPITDEMPAMDGGFFNHFLATAVPGKPERSIYAHRDTGVHEVLDEIRKKWAESGWDHGPLGFPRGPEITLDDNTGKLQLYQSGWICWHPDTGAHIVKGAIAERWEQLGRNHFGYPITDELPAMGGGFFNHFRALAVPGQPERSIYAHADTGAYGVMDEIRARWAELGWDHGPLGFPVGPEEDGPDSTRRQFFQYGGLSWHASRGAGVDWIRKWQVVATPPGTALGGWVEVDLHWNGDYIFRGHMHDSGALDYDLRVEALLVAADMVLLMRKSGSVEGSESLSPKRDFDWEEHGSDSQIRAHWPTLIQSSFHVSKGYEIAGIGSVLAEVVKDALSFLIQAQVLGPHIALAVLIGSELRGRLDLPILGSNAFPSILVTAGTSFLIGPTFAIPVFVGTSLVTAAVFESRQISDHEYEFANLVFGGSLPDRDRIILTNVSGLEDAKFVVPNGDGRFLVNLTKEVFDYPGGPILYHKTDRAPGELLIHELTHVWQNVHTNFHPYMMCRFVGTQILAGDAAYRLPAADTKLWEIGTEELAVLVATWFRNHSARANLDGSFTALWANLQELRAALDRPAAVNDPYYHFIAEMRTARP